MAWTAVAYAAVAVGSQLLNTWIETENSKEQEAQAKARAKWEAAQLRIRQGFLELRAEEALFQGDKEAREYRKRVNKFKGAQKAAVAASGISVDSGTAIDIQRETADQGALDVLTIKNNAWKAAFGLEQEATAAGFAAQATELTGKSQAESIARGRELSILGGVSSAGASGALTYKRLSS